MSRQRPGRDQTHGTLWRNQNYVDVNSSENQFAGITTLASGSATVTVSTFAVNSDSLILHGAVGNANVASGTSRAIEVKTFGFGSFTFGTMDGQPVPRSTDLHWLLWRTKW